jgi:hypothetical protein
MSDVPSGRGTDTALDSLHGLVALTLTEQIQAYKNGDVRDGEGNKLPIPAALIAQALKFLSDNGIDAPAALPRTEALKRALPTFDPSADTSVLQFRTKAS